MTTVATPLISEQAEKVLNHRYLLKDTEGEVVENSNAMFKRVAKAIASIEKTHFILPVEAELRAVLPIAILPPSPSAGS